MLLYTVDVNMVIPDRADDTESDTGLHFCCYWMVLKVPFNKDFRM